MRPRFTVAGVMSALAFLMSAAVPAPAATSGPAANGAAVDRALAWLATQQQPDGGFEVAEFPGFETPEAVLAIAASATRNSPWSAALALRAAQSVTNDKGLTGLDYLDDFAEGAGDDAITGGVAAKLITLTAAPLCLSATRFDPQGDGATNLVAIMDAAARDNGAYGEEGVFSDTLYAALAHAALGRAVPAKTIEFIKAAQEDDGGWNFLGSPGDQGFDDIDTTALALQALIAAGVGMADAAVADGVSYLVGLQADDGSWGFGDPNSTAVASLALHSANTEPANDPHAFLRAQQREDGRVASPNDSFGVNTYATTQSVRAMLEGSLPIRPTAGTCPGEGYALFGADGGVFAFGATAFRGSAGSIRLNSPIVGGAVTATGNGYYLFAADGGVFSYGDASFYGSLGAIRLNSPVVGGTVTPSGRGYVLFAADGGVFAFGDAGFLGSMGSRPLNSPIVSGAVTPDGYYLFAADGGVFAFGAPFLGSMATRPLNQPVVGGGATPTGFGYVLAARDGGVFAFGDAPFVGSAAATPPRDAVVDMAMGPTGNGYALFTRTSEIFAYGDAVISKAVTPITQLNAPIVGGSVD